MNILLIGESGSGKTTSFRNLNPETTFYNDADKKGLSWRGWGNQYNKNNKNYIRNSNPEDILKTLKTINNNPAYKHIKTIIVDTLNGIMIDYEYQNYNTVGYDKYKDLAYSIYGLITESNTFRKDLTVIFTCHSEMLDNGFKHAMTSGNKLSKIKIESKFSLVIESFQNSEGEFKFRVKGDGTSTVKSPLDMFRDSEIPNDINYILDAIKNYEKDSGEPFFIESNTNITQEVKNEKETKKIEKKNNKLKSVKELEEDSTFDEIDDIFFK